MSKGPELTPREILRELDQDVVGQDRAKRAVAVALRNRWRRRQLPRDLAENVYPKNILLIGPTGVGKTEIARRLASLARAPFVKVEATKYSEVGYHGRDVESMVRDLVENSVAMVRREHAEAVRERASSAADERLFEALCFSRGLLPTDRLGRRAGIEALEGGFWKAPPVGDRPEDAEGNTEDPDPHRAERETLRAALRDRSIETETCEIEVLDDRTPTLNITGPQGNDAMGIDTRALQEMWGRAPAQRTKVRRLTIAEARKIGRRDERPFPDSHCWLTRPSKD